MNSKGSSDLMAEAVAAIGPYKVFLARKRVEVQAQIAEMQGAGVAIDPTPTGVMPDPLPALPGWDTTVSDASGDGSSSGQEESPEGVTKTASPTTDQLNPGAVPATRVRDAEVPTASTPTGTLPSDPVPTGSTPSAQGETAPPSELSEKPTGNAVPVAVEAALARLNAALSREVVATLPRSVQSVWRDRHQEHHAQAPWICMLVEGEADTRLPETVAEAVAELIAVDDSFREAHTVLRSGVYPELYGFDWEDTEAAEEAEGEADHAAERGKEPF